MDRYLDILELSCNQEPTQDVKTGGLGEEKQLFKLNHSFEESLERSVEELHQQLKKKLLIDVAKKNG